ncbi:hypothetical protein [Actinoplanes derwentensis]|uniref:4-amino-4-deoxy-L-arabinose transferase n=1 Tax=Actinoplanes derwentensis TaxID=113562 RepID=A0A1H2C3R7_9ACTN|nr:hypothetical protein [Actinoplanes derwentensis]GID84167.1 MFS transporter [Actinoplanes derwentensis]SDT65215.1 hypothetical protein SAMN04489716_5222 [Actinoplanes derwentensis]
MWARHRLEWSTALTAAALGVLYLLLPPMGSDLAAQVARTGFFTGHGFTPVDLRWYSGIEQFGYSLIAQPVMALLGVRVAGVLTLVAGPVLLTTLLRRTGAARPALGAVLGTVTFAGNLISGRVTYGLGVCLGLAALLTLTFLAARTPAPPSPRVRGLVAAGAVLAAFLTGAASPVAGLFLGLAGVALLLSGHYRAGLLVAVPAAVPLALTSLLFGDGGWMNISRTDTTQAVLTGLVVAALVPVRPIRIGALISCAGVLAAALIHTPVGLNATRLAVMFGLPILAAYAELPRRCPGWAVYPLVAVMVWWQPPVVISDVRDVGNPSADPAYFQPLLDRLAEEPLTGRVEIPPTRSYWEAASLGEIPLARGWLRQADIDRNPLFFTTVPGASGTGVELTADSYRAWLDEQAVQFVAVPDVEISWSGRTEAQMVTAGLPYLSLIWSSEHWRLYAVAAPRPIVAAPATLVRQDAATIVLDAPAAGEIPVRVRHHRWLTVSGGATVTADGAWTRIRVPAAGRYTLTSDVTLAVRR